MAEQKKPQQEQDINQLRKVRREKLANLQEAGKDPFQITKFDQTMRLFPDALQSRKQASRL